MLTLEKKVATLDDARFLLRGVVAAKSGLTLDPSGCPMLDATTSGTLVAQLAHGTAGAAPTSDFAGQNVLSIVIEVDTALVTPGGKFLGISGSTHQRA